MAATLPELQTIALRRGASNGGELRIELNRPDSLNAWDGQLAADLLAAVELARADDGVRAVTITGAGRAFCSGADLRAGFDEAPDGRPDLRKALRERYHPVITGVRRMPKPVLAAVNGAAAGVGCSLALACDIVLAAESAYFLLAFVNIGLVPDGGASVFIPARAGAGRAAEMALLGERVPAATGRAWGLVDRLVSDESFGAEADALAERLATGPTRAYAGAKAQINARVYAGLEEQLEVEASLQHEAAGSADFREGVAAFLEKRPARFEGE
jgi:2-(1,2-epoxy-1,2-dihydrophenyl)acetyl-CoA isomerase